MEARAIPILSGQRVMRCGQGWKRFGKFTNGSFGALWPWISNDPDPITEDFFVGYTNCVFYNDDRNLWQGRTEYPEERVWFSREYVRNGIDTVVEAALRWIESENSRRELRVGVTFQPI